MQAVGHDWASFFLSPQLPMWLRRDFQGDSVVKNLPAEQEFGVCSLCLENSLEKKVAMHSSILAWEISWTKEPGRVQSMGSERVRHGLATKQNNNSIKDASIQTWAR